ncbi:MAG: HD domain-containing protein [Acidobacteriaceae bacterium]|nr:HD domain-containing protein [Acidobacteriaceae bacterium]MBV9308759.1 HD domain-containing protein [Acidobacteriaceae bacterium]
METTTFRSSTAANSSRNAQRQNPFDDVLQHTRNKILIVAGSSQQRRALAQIFRGLALETAEAADTLEALALATAYGVSLVILDLHSDGYSAINLCQTLKGARGTQLLPVFIIAENGSVEDEIRAIEAGADAFFATPLHPQILRARVQASLRHKALVDSLDDSESALLSLAQSVEGRDGELGQHCQRLALMVSMMGRALGLRGQDIVTLQRAAYLHDIGKVSIPDDILFKAGPLAPDEWEIMKSHAEKGERICSGMRSLTPVLPIIRHHHEKWNGSGYPDCLKGEEIPLLARILQLADIYDALTTSRCYKKAFTAEQAKETMQEEARKGWRDPKLTEQFTELIPVFSTAAIPDLACLSLHALGSSLQGTAKNAGEEQLKIPGLYNTPINLN